MNKLAAEINTQHTVAARQKVCGGVAAISCSTSRLPVTPRHVFALARSETMCLGHPVGPRNATVTVVSLTPPAVETGIEMRKTPEYGPLLNMAVKLRTGSDDDCT